MPFNGSGKSRHPIFSMNVRCCAASSQDRGEKQRGQNQGLWDVQSGRRKSRGRPGVPREKILALSGRLRQYAVLIYIR